MAPPVGLQIGNKPDKPTHRVGKLIGEGACSSVYALTSIHGGSDKEFAIKLTPLPAGTKKKRSKPTTVERNANLLHLETLMYKAHLIKLCGKYIPRLPSSKDGPPPSGDVNGYRFLVLERMEAPLSDVIPRLLAGKRKAGGKIPFGPVAVQLLECVKAVHESGYVVIDVKPDNFMLASHGSTLAKKVRMLDFALIQNLRGIEGHRKNQGISGIVGTPLYSSLHMHKGSTPSRRDDVEALGYVIAELIMKLIAAANNKSEVNLPWAGATSDEEIAQLKEQQLTATRSKFFEQLGAHGNAKVEQIMRDFFSTCQEMSFKETPDYDDLRDLLLHLDVVALDKKKKPASTRKKTPVRTKSTPTTGRTTRRASARAAKRPSPSSDYDDVVAPVRTKSGRTTRTSARAAKRPSPSHDEDVLVIDDDDSGEKAAPRKIRRSLAIDDDQYDASVEDDFKTANEGEAMDWESVEESDDENQAPRVGVQVLVEEGPHKGETFSLVKNRVETAIVGSDPTHKQGELGFRLDQDENVDETHLKLVLFVGKKNVVSVGATDLKSSTGSFVNEKPMASRKESRLFMNDSVQIGSTALKIVPLSAAKAKAAPQQKKKAAKTPTVVHTDEEDLVSPLPEEPKKKSNGPGVVIRFTEGPYRDQSIVLQQGATESIVLGSNPKATKSAEAITLDGDSEIEANHARLTLSISRNVCSVNATDLKSKGGCFVNSKRVASGKDQKAFMNDTIQIGETVMKVSPLA